MTRHLRRWAVVMLLPENVRNDRKVAMAYARTRRGAYAWRGRLAPSWPDRQLVVERAR